MDRNKKLIKISIIGMILLISICTPSIAIKGNNSGFIKKSQVSLDTSFINNIVSQLSEIAVLKDNNSEYLYPKGRFFGSEGEKIARQFLYNMWLNYISDDVILSPITDSNDYYHETLDYGLTVYNNSGFIEVPKIESFPYLTESQEQINHVFTNAKIKLFPLEWLNNHCQSVSVKKINLPTSYQMQNTLKKVDYIENYKDANLDIEIGTIHLIDILDKPASNQLDTLTNQALDFGADGIIFISDFINIEINEVASIPTFFVSKADGEFIKKQIIENEDIIIDFTNKYGCGYNDELVIYNFSQIDLEKMIGRPSGQELWLMSYNYLYTQLWFNYLETRQEKWNIKIGFIIRDENKETYFMDNYHHNIPGISINGTVGKWIRNQIKNGVEVSADFFINQQYVESIESYNIVGTIGENDDKVIIIEGHYDSMWGQFTIDDGVGIASLFGIAKYFADNYNNEPPNCKLKFIAFTGEENRFRGSRSYIELYGSELLDSDVICIINLDTFAQKQNFPFTIRYYSGPDGVTESVLENDLEDIFVNTDYDERTCFSYYHDIVNLLSNIKNANLLKGRCDAGTLYQFLEENDNLPRNVLLVDKFDVMHEENMQFFYQRSGKKHYAGDSINLLDRNDLNISNEVLIEVIKYFDSGEGLEFLGENLMTENEILKKNLQLKNE